MSTPRSHQQPTQTVLLTGLGLVTPLGRSAWETMASLLAGRTTADRLTETPVDVDLTTLARMTGGSCLAGFTLTDPAIELADRASREAIEDAGIERRGALRTIVASSKGAVSALMEGERSSNRALCVALSPHGRLASELRLRLGLGETTAVVSACATSMAALEQARREILSGRERRVLVVAVEAALHPVFVNSYRRLGVLAPWRPISSHVARPLDERRAGFTLCECAAAVVLETEEEGASSRGACGSGRAKARLLDVAIGDEPFDMVRPAPSFKTLERLVKRVTPAGRRVSLLQPHATGTRDNDEREMEALASVLGAEAAHTPVYASKGALGHGLGASGLVNVALGCLIAKVGRRPPMRWLDEPICTPFHLTREEEPVAPGPQVCVAAGFGGHVGAACFEPISPMAPIR